MIDIFLKDLHDEKDDPSHLRYLNNTLDNEIDKTIRFFINN